MKNKKCAILLAALMVVAYYFISTYTTGEKMCKKLNLENTNKVVAAYDNGGTTKAPENFTLTLSEDEKTQLMDYLKSLKLKKHRDDYIYVNSWEMYAFDFQFDNGRTVVYLYGDEFINVVSTDNGACVKYNIIK